MIGNQVGGGGRGGILHCHPSSELCRRCLAAASLLPVGGCSLSIMAINSSAGRSLFPISACPLWFSLRRCTVSSDCGCAVLSYVLCPMWPPCCRRRPVETFRPCAPQGVHAAAYPTKRPPSEITSERRTDHNPHTRCAGIRLDLEHRGVPGVLGSPEAARARGPCGGAGIRRCCSDITPKRNHNQPAWPQGLLRESRLC